MISNKNPLVALVSACTPPEKTVSIFIQQMGTTIQDVIENDKSSKVLTRLGIL